ncbi:hypothetical protein HCG51_09600 [Tolypothrix sp. PCC 7910]|nr:hypothetical protein [Tolypothrix sp. PCC 7910]QIR36966.1 hypothetical protein HCG51_09600 [Tolypothrix sp. PCC 7910]
MCDRSPIFNKDAIAYSSAIVKNPLRLTLLCLNWQSGDGKLPDTQAGLY